MVRARLISVGCAALAITASIFFVLLGWGQSAKGDSSSNHVASVGGSYHVSSKLKSAFSLLDQARTSSASSPNAATLEKGMGSLLHQGSTYGLDFNTAQEVQRDSLDVYVIPGRSGVCVLVAEPAASGSGPGTLWVPACDLTGNVVKDGLVDSLYAADPKTNTDSGVLVSLVPDGNSTVTVRGDGGARTIPVVDNVAVANVSATPNTSGTLSVSFNAPDGTAVASTQRIPSLP